MRNAVWILHNYPPVILAGAEMAAHRINCWLLSQGWNVTVYIFRGPSYPSSFEGVRIEQLNDPYSLTFPPHTLLFSQLWAGRIARTLADMKQVKYIEFIHYVDHTIVAPYPWTTKRDFTLVFNSDDTRARTFAIAPWLKEVKTFLMHPIVDAVHAVCRTDPSLYPWITLVNVSVDKGAPVFYDLARRMKGAVKQRFVGIRGAHGTQENETADVLLLDPTQDMETVWNNTCILCIPSKYETWSMVASEAMARGIPVIASDHIPAIAENCGDAALYVNRESLDEWNAAIQKILVSYGDYSALGLTRVYDSIPVLQTILSDAGFEP